MMLHLFEAKTKEEVIKKMERELNVKSYELISFVEEENLGLFKGKKYIGKALVTSDLVTFVKEHLIRITDLMGININIEVKRRKDSVTFMLYSDNSPILIGKNGKNLDSLQTIIKQAILNEIGMYINIVIDVENYKENIKRKIEKIAKLKAEEVLQTKQEVELDPMNSYERKIVHTVISEIDGVETESIGVAPNRYVVIKIKEDY